MQCQLAKLVGEDVHFPGKLVWTVVAPPVDICSYDYTKGPGFLSPICLHFELCYFGKGDERLFVVQHESIELLPHFTNRDPTPWEEWVAKGGESIPGMESR